MQRDSVVIQGIRMPLYSTNTLIIGSGAAALNSAVQLFEFGQRDILIATDYWGGGTSSNARSDKQTYYKLSLSGDILDSPFAMAKDLFEGGCMHGDIALCEAQHSAQAFLHLVRLGLPFPQDKYGGFPGYKTDHDPRGRGTSAGPLTSHYMFEALAGAVKKRGIPVLDQHEVIALLTADKDTEKCVIGAIALDKRELEADNSGFVLINAVNVVLATGGPGGIYRWSVYPEGQMGSTGLAFKIGAAGQNLTESQFGLASIKPRWNASGSYQQAIPRYLSIDKKGSDEREFLSEVFPDIGTLATAIFLKGYQWPFDPRKVTNYGSSLIDILVYWETTQKGRRVFLDYRRNPSDGGNLDDFSLKRLQPESYQYLEQSGALLDTPIERLRKLNPPAIEIFKGQGIDLTRDYLEIAVCAQHNNGGLKGNIWWESNIKHLFPVGEVNGSHGVYRPGGAALNAGQVGGLRAATFISKRYGADPPTKDDFITLSNSQIRETFAFARKLIEPGADGNTLTASLNEIQERMSRCGALIRRSSEVEKAISDTWQQYKNLNEKMRISSAEDLPRAHKILDLCLTHAMYLEAIGEYLRKGGRSRGSYLVMDPRGEKPCEEMEDEWRFGLNEEDAFVDGKILEIWLDEAANVKKKWVDVRPIPQEGRPFEAVWKDFREDQTIA